MSGRVSSFLGGSPLSVAVRLVVISLLVGVLLSWLDIRPVELLDGAVNLLRWAWFSIFGSLNRALDYFILGAVIVVPIFFLSRLLKSSRG